MTVSLVKFDGSLDSLRKAIQLCDGFSKLHTSHSVLIKPNNCFRHKAMPPYGMVTTSWIVEGVVQLLLEYGCRDISIGEGAIIGIFDELQPYTKRGFKGTSIERIARKYGVKLVDFNHHPFYELDLAGTKVEVSQAAIDTDFLINIPVLKTHFQAKVSLGFKNMKGCLSPGSKKRFHTGKQLDTLICLLNEAVKSDLVIIDGIYMLEKGPETLVGIAHRKDLIIAGTDIFECDVVGAAILGVDPAQVDYLREFAEKNNRSFDLGTIRTRGESLESVKEKLEWRFEPDKELLGLANVAGISAPHPGHSLCSGCGATLALALSIFGNDNRGADFGGAAFYYGLDLKPEGDVAKVFLYGDCAIRSNKNSVNAIKIDGCPPTLTKALLVLMKSLLTKPRMLRMLIVQGIRLAGMRLGLQQEIFPRWRRYRGKEFDRKLF